MRLAELIPPLPLTELWRVLYYEHFRGNDFLFDGLTLERGRLLPQEQSAAEEALVRFWSSSTYSELRMLVKGIGPRERGFVYRSFCLAMDQCNLWLQKRAH